LVEGLDEGLNGKLTLVSAPAGYGKTTLVSSWVNAIQTPAAWFSVDEGDNDLSRFLAYLASALQTRFPETGESLLIGLQSPQSPPTEHLLTTLINDVHGIGSDFILVLDDYHFIDSKPVHDALIFLLDHLPPQMHLVLAGRTDPPLPLSRLRVSGNLNEVRSADLRFTLKEASTFLQELAGIEISPEGLQALEIRTEGWIAGLQLAAISMRGQEDVSSFIEAFKGSQRFVIDYLVEEVLNQQSLERQDFLLKTSILERMTASLCNAVVETGDSQSVLNAIDAENLFLVPLDSERRWYRYHHLFADFIRQRLEQAPDIDIPDLHLRASSWYEGKGNISQAINHALAAKDLDLTVNLIERNGMSRIMRGEVNTVRNWLESLPEDRIKINPQLNIFYAWVLFLSGQLNESEEYLQDAETGIKSSPSTKDEVKPVQDRELLAEVLTTRSFIVRNQPGGSPHGIELANQALQLVPDENLNLQGLAQMSLGTCYRDIDHQDESVAAYSAAVDLCLAAGNYLAAINSMYQLSRGCEMLGQLHKAATICRQGLAEAAQRVERGLRPYPAEGILHVGLGSVLYEWNELKSAEQSFKEGIRLGELSGFWDTALMGRIFLSRLQQSLSDHQGALATNALALEAARKSDAPIAYRNTLTNRARLWIAQGDLVKADQWARDVVKKSGKEVSYLHNFEQITLSRYYLASGEPEKASKLLHQLVKPVEESGRWGTMIEVLALQSLAMQAQGDVERAIAPMEQALSLAEPEGYVRIFIDLGPEMKGPLQSIISADGNLKAYAQTLLAAYQDAEPQGTSDKTQTLVEPLSERELEVLALLSQGMSGPEISAELFVSLNTIKSHIKNIYSKLGVNKRFDAIERARELGII
jgi:LuxR family maltose regulon positive regulatory protein